MKRLLQFAVIIIISYTFLLEGNAAAQAKRKANKETDEWHYEAECVQIGVEGTKMIKIWSYSKKPDVATMQAKKNAIHAVIFKGFSGNKSAGCPAQRPLASLQAEDEHAAFFKDFFADHGKYMRYVSLANGEESGAGERLKIDRPGRKDMYKVGIVVTVMYSQLRKDLEEQGIIKSLSNGF